MSDYARGPGRAGARSRGAVIEAYVDTEALDHKCPTPKGGCGADKGELCHHPNGAERKMPCPVRIPARPESEIQGEAL